MEGTKGEIAAPLPRTVSLEANEKVTVQQMQG